ncbi:PREDICTED: integrator complex subunit 3 [Prunus dulcis]|uniref:PREDICTED: integrator complex subunit 3 n=2 Tax=Prunus dulcis TaxID=3755 RepID=A0A5E4FB85_PRUDU|nr:PREDICTED: integrator complex subunit 3 [Prunus dulcis]
MAWEKRCNTARKPCACCFLSFAELALNKLVPAVARRVPARSDGGYRATKSNGATQETGSQCPSELSSRAAVPYEPYMALKLMQIAPHEAEDPTELSLRQAFELLEPKLRPPFSLTIPKPQEYSLLNKAILYGVLYECHLGKTHIKHLHAIVTDGYGLFVSFLTKVVNELYVKLLEPLKCQLIWVTKELIDVLAVGVDGLLVCLLRQIVGGDFSDGNLWLCFEMVNILLTKWDCLLEVESMILTSGLYTYLRLLADHCRQLSNPKLEALKQLEIDFCIKVLKEQFPLCLKIGRDLVRLLQDLVHLPKFRAIWKDLVLNQGEFKSLGFSGIAQLYITRTPSQYMLLRITPEMEAQLRFLLTHVKLGSHKRHQAWFAKKFLCEPNRETVIVDIVRFICCAHHPPNEIIQSDVIPRWAVIGWLLKSCTKNYVEANAKLALLYDWLFFEERVDNIMNIEPAMLLMVCSIPRYIDITHTLLEFLFLLMDNYDAEHYDILVKGVSSSFSVCVKKGVIRSLDVLTSCDALSPILKERLGRFLLGTKFEISGKLIQARLPGHFERVKNSTCMETPTPSPESMR